MLPDAIAVYVPPEPLKRPTRDQVVSAGRIDFKAQSQTEVKLEIPGLVSCTDTTDCPMGQTCQPDLRCQ